MLPGIGDDQAAIQASVENEFGGKSNICGTNALGLSGITTTSSTCA